MLMEEDEHEFKSHVCVCLCAHVSLEEGGGGGGAIWEADARMMHVDFKNSSGYQVGYDPSAAF